MTSEEHEALLRQALAEQRRANDQTEAMATHAREHAKAVSAEFMHAQAHREAMAKEVSTLRDDFAMAALTGLLADAPVAATHAEIAQEAYFIADAMLAERAK